PAGLAAQGGLRATLDASLAWQRLTFTPASGEPAVSNDAAPFVAPAIVGSYGFGRLGPLSELTLAPGVTGPPAVGRARYPAGGAQRYALISSDTTLANFSAAVAAALGRWLAAGATLQLVRGHARFTQAVWSGNDPGTDPAFDTIAHADVTSGLVPA